MRRSSVLAVLAIGAASAGCGTSPGSGRPEGQELFSQDCAACHSVDGRQTPSRQGGDLLHLQVGRSAMVQFVREMPVRKPLSPGQLQAVAAYVLAVEHRGRRDG